LPKKEKMKQRKKKRGVRCKILKPSIYWQFDRTCGQLNLARGRPLTEIEVTDHRRIRDLRHGRPVEISHKLLITTEGYFGHFIRRVSSL
jgi:hypothetical protein